MTAPVRKREVCLLQRFAGVVVHAIICRFDGISELEMNCAVEKSRLKVVGSKVGQDG